MPLTLSDILRHSVSYARLRQETAFSLLSPSVSRLSPKNLQEQQPNTRPSSWICCSNKSQSCPHRHSVPHVPPTAVARQLSKRSHLPRTTHPPPALVTPLSTAAPTPAQVPHPGNARQTPAQSANAPQCRPHHRTTTINRQRQQQGLNRLRRRKRKRVERVATAKRYRSPSLKPF